MQSGVMSRTTVTCVKTGAVSKEVPIFCCEELMRTAMVGKLVKNYVRAAEKHEYLVLNIIHTFCFFNPVGKPQILTETPAHYGLIKHIYSSEVRKRINFVLFPRLTKTCTHYFDPTIDIFWCQLSLSSTWKTLPRNLN